MQSRGIVLGYFSQQGSIMLEVYCQWEIRRNVVITV